LKIGCLELDTHGVYGFLVENGQSPAKKLGSMAVPSRNPIWSDWIPQPMQSEFKTRNNRNHRSQREHYLSASCPAAVHATLQYLSDY
jgi:hypothetical protein